MCSTSGDVFTALEAAVDLLLVDDVDALSDAQRLERVRAWARIQNKVAAGLTREVRAAENHQSAESDGLGSMRSWLRTHTRIPDPVAKRLIETGRALQSLPVAEAAFTAGAIGAEQVAASAPIVTVKRLAQAAALGVDVPAIEAELVGIAGRVS